MKRQLGSLAITLAVAVTCATATAADLRAKAKSAGLAAIPAGTPKVQDNALTREKIALGIEGGLDKNISIKIGICGSITMIFG